MRTAIVGASGYAGGELIRIVDRHPHLDLDVLVADRRAGRPLSEVHPHLPGRHRILAALDQEQLEQCAVVFLALPHGASAELGQALKKAGTVVVDLGSDHRLDTDARYRMAYGEPHPHPEELGEWVYALPELFGARLPGANGLAVPGCYPTAALLGLGPLISAGLVEGPDVVVDAISGVTGAGRGLADDLLFGAVAEGFKAYGVGGHRHRPEMEMAAEALGGAVRITFTPHLAPIQRGLLATVSVPTSAGPHDVVEALQLAYANCPVVDVADRPPSTRWVAGSHGALLWGTVDEHSGRAIVVTVIDNLGKGAAGQAVQALNLAMEWDETTGLRLDGWLP